MKKGHICVSQYHTVCHTFTFMLRWPKRILTQQNRWLDPEAIGVSRTIHGIAMQGDQRTLHLCLLKCTKGSARPQERQSGLSDYSAYVGGRVPAAHATQSSCTWRRPRIGRSSIHWGGRTVVAHTHNNITESGSNSLTLLPGSVRRDFSVPNSKFSIIFIPRSVLKSTILKKMV